MSSIWLYALASVAIVSIVSLAGLLTYAFSEEKLRNFGSFMLSLAAGAMLGNAFLHLLPETVSGVQERWNAAQASGNTHAHQGDDHHDDKQDAHHRQAHGHHTHLLSAFALVLGGIFGFFAFDLFLHSTGKHGQQGVKPVGYLLLIGDGLENFIDGMVIGAAYLISIPVGIATTIAVVVHEIPIELADYAVLLEAGFNRRRALLVNFCSALAAVLGVVLALGAGGVAGWLPILIAPVAAGAFIYMAGSSLIPQIRHDASLKGAFVHFFAVVLGTGVTACLLFLE